MITTKVPLSVESKIKHVELRAEQDDVQNQDHNIVI